MPRISHSWIRTVYQHSSVQDTHERCWNAWQGAGQFFHIPQPSLGHFTGSIFPLSMAYLQPHYMHTHVHTCHAHTSLPDASPPERGIPDCGPSTVAAQVNSQASVSLSRSFPSFPPLKEPYTLRPAPYRPVLKTALEKAVIRTPTWHEPWFGHQRYLCPSSFPAPWSQIVSLVDGASGTGEQILEARGTGANHVRTREHLAAAPRMTSQCLKVASFC